MLNMRKIFKSIKKSRLNAEDCQILVQVLCESKSI